MRWTAEQASARHLRFPSLGSCKYAEPILPIALSTPAWAGISAVAGAFVGATAGALLDAIFAYRRESAMARAGARLVAADLSMSDHQLKGVQKDERWWGFHKPPTSNWNEYRNVLAIRLSNEEFEAVSEAVMNIQFLSESVLKAPGFQGPGKSLYVELGAATVAPVRRHAATAYNALAELGGHRRVDEMINP